MVITNGHTTTPHQRQNRRRERPGSRTRRTITRKSHMQSFLEEDCHEAILDARDASLFLPFDKTKPSPLLRENFDQSWQRWQSKKAKQQEEEALAERERQRIEQEQIMLFGGDINDDELYRLGILYNDEESTHDEENSIASGLPVEKAAPIFVIRQGKPRRTRRSKPMLPLYLSFSDFGTDVDIARLLSLSQPQTPTIQHRVAPQSLPLPSALESGSQSHSFLPQLDIADWTFIETAHTLPQISPASEPETWILLGDDS